MSGAQQFRFKLDNDSIYQLRGYKLLEMESDHDGLFNKERWINLSLYYSRENIFVLIIRYDSQPTSKWEPEKPYLHVEKIDSWHGMGRFLDTYDFMQHVNIDFYCGGHCSMMSGSGVNDASVRLHFRQTALKFLETCLEKRGDWRVKHQIDIW